MAAKQRTLSVTLFSDFLGIALQSAIDQRVFSCLSKVYRESEAPRSESHVTGHNVAATAITANRASLSTIVFACLGLESWFNLVAQRVLPEEKYHTFVRHESPEEKLKKLIKELTKRSEYINESPHKEIRALFQMRNGLVHDKGSYPQDVPELSKALSANSPRVSPWKALDIVCAVQTYGANAHPELAEPSIKERLDLGGYGEWSGPDLFPVMTPLPFAGAAFPNERTYNQFVRRHLAAYPPRCELDRARCRIVPVAE